MRCFIGLPLNEDYQLMLGEIIRQWKPRLRSRMSWTSPGNWHLTLKFLGETSQEQISLLREALVNSRPAAFRLQGQGGGFFPNPDASRKTFRRGPRVLWVGLGRGVEETRELAGWVQDVTETLGFPREERAFRPHLTVARIKQPEKDPWTEILENFQKITWPETIIDRMVLWESRLSPSGPEYEPLADWRLETGTKA